MFTRSCKWPFNPSQGGAYACANRTLLPLCAHASARRGTGIVVFRSLPYLLLCFRLCAAPVSLSGRVTDENNTPVGDAHVTIRPSVAAGPVSQAQGAATSVEGSFHLTLPGPGEFLVSVKREGYYPITDQPVEIEAARELTLVINTAHPVHQAVNVAEAQSPLDAARTNSQHLTGIEMNNIPYPNSHSLRDAFKLMPGVVEDASGSLHPNGAAENQVLYTLNGFDIGNPVSDRFQTALAVEGIHSTNLSTGAYSPQYGEGSAGVLAIATENGTDAFHYTTTDFIPGVNLQQGLHLGNWFPRLGVSGPIVRGHAWYSDTFGSGYRESIVTGLPSGQNSRTGWVGSNLLHTQINLSPSNILFVDFLVNVDNEGRVGLSPLSPVSTTSTLHRRQYFGSVKDQAYLGGGVTVEFGYAHNQFSDRQTPQGENLYVFSPMGQSGNYFVNSTGSSSRDQGTAHVYLPQLQWAGSHQIEAGMEAGLRRYQGDFRRTGYEVLGLSGQMLSQTLFPSAAMFHVSDAGAAVYLRDAWRISKRFQLDVGVRQDWNQRITGVAWSPRAAFSWSPFAAGRIRVSGGYAITHDEISLDTLSRPLDQAAVTTLYSSGLARQPIVTAFAIGNARLALPRATNWSLSVEDHISNGIYVNASYLRRRGTDGFAYVNTLAPDAPPSLLPLPGGQSGGFYQLTNLRRDDYDSVQISVRQTLTGQYEWMASYTHSRAVSNVVIDPNSTQALQVLPGFVPMPWDAPDRFLAWAYLPLPFKNWAISGLSEMRSGFPFSVRDQNGLVSGAVNSYRYPVNYDLDIAIERMVTLHGYRFALRCGVDNLTDQRNSTAVNNVIGAPQFLQFFGDDSRHFVVRLRFFGRAEKTR
jgi:Carboxypeptidase regulatory-like domain/TonB dependent receptor-like, beta-barrel